MTNQNQEDPTHNFASGRTIQPFTRVDLKRSIVEILEFVGTDGLASLENLHHKFWPYVGVQSCRRFLSLLEREGWVDRHFIHVYKPGQLVFSLTAKGASDNFSQAARKNLMIGLPANQEEKQFASEGKRIISWQNERQLRRETIRKIKSGQSTLHALNEIADARMTVSDETGRVFSQEIEIDGEYYGQMLKTKLETYGRKGLPLLWVTTQNRAVRIRKEMTMANITNISLLVLEKE
jgi:hypothetical protein